MVKPEGTLEEDWKKLRDRLQGEGKQLQGKMGFTMVGELIALAAAANSSVGIGC